MSAYERVDWSPVLGGFGKYTLNVLVSMQVLVVQALRPDRLQSAMSLFASKALGKFDSAVIDFCTLRNHG